MGITLGTSTKVSSYVDSSLKDQVNSNTASLADKATKSDIDVLKGSLQRRFSTYGCSLEKQNTIMRCVHHDNFTRANNSSAIGENSDVVGLMPWEVQANSLLIGILNNTAYCSNYQSVPNRGYILVTRNADWVAEVVTVDGYRAAVVLDYVDLNNVVFAEIYTPANGTIRVKTTRYKAGVAQPTIDDSYIPVTNNITFERKGNTFIVNGLKTFTISDLAPSTKMGLMFGWGNDYRVNNYNLYYKDNYVNIPIDDGLEQNYSTYFTTQSASKSYSFNVVSDITNNSKSAWRFELHDDDGLSNVGSVRSEIAINRRLLVPIDRVLTELWTSFDVYFPADFGKDSDYDSFYQIHDEQENWTGMPGHSPIFALLTKDDKLWLDVRAKSNKDINVWPPLNVYPLGDVPKGRWMNVEIKMKERYEASLNPHLTIMFDGEVVADLSIPNCYNTVYGGYQKFGIYKWTWATSKTDVSKRVIYYDNVKCLI